jgi:hypothetical protein
MENDKRMDEFLGDWEEAVMDTNRKYGFGFNGMAWEKRERRHLNWKAAS